MENITIAVLPNHVIGRKNTRHKKNWVNQNKWLKNETENLRWKKKLFVSIPKPLRLKCNILLCKNIRTLEDLDISLDSFYNFPQNPGLWEDPGLGHHPRYQNVCSRCNTSALINKQSGCSRRIKSHKTQTQ